MADAVASGCPVHVVQGVALLAGVASHAAHPPRRVLEAVVGNTTKGTAPTLS